MEEPGRGTPVPEQHLDAQYTSGWMLQEGPAVDPEAVLLQQLTTPGPNVPAATIQWNHLHQFLLLQQGISPALTSPDDGRIGPLSVGILGPCLLAFHTAVAIFTGSRLQCILEHNAGSLFLPRLSRPNSALEQSRMGRSVSLNHTLNTLEIDNLVSQVSL